MCLTVELFVSRNVFAAVVLVLVLALVLACAGAAASVTPWMSRCMYITLSILFQFFFFVWLFCEGISFTRDFKYTFSECWWADNWQTLHMQILACNERRERPRPRFRLCGVNLVAVCGCLICLSQQGFLVVSSTLRAKRVVFVSLLCGLFSCPRNVVLFGRTTCTTAP